ncbi:GumC family protein [Bremerella alba]|uniref:Chain length determinant protein n=1 Tax=Bremerella alba TaxID=980252 RepID=A0A7V9A5E3_9BACT|nr:hypothetical protein [Bremerella alba]MBA2113087.1 hypothetical protein [Bremerella alba]
MFNPADILFALVQYRLRWIIPTILVAAAALAYAVVKPNSWEATQSIVLRDEAVSSLGRPGQFTGVEDMKHAQETVLQLTRSREVIQVALQELGAPANRWSTANWPSKDDIAAARKSISVHSPGGTEFGTTEMLYITVEADTPERANRLNQLICAQLDQQLGEMRNSRALSLVEELNYRQQQADQALSSVTDRLSELESEVGTDLAELRILNEVGSGNGNLREQLLQIKNELRTALANQQSSQRLLEILEAAQQNTSELIATPNQLLESQPSLRRLKEGLIDAQLRSAQLQGIRTESHPGVVAARHAEEEIRGHLHQEIAIAIRSLNAEQSVNNSRIAQLQTMLDDVSERMTKLASLRAGYNNLVAEVREKNNKLTQIRTDLADARSSVEAATTTTLVTKVSIPEVSDYPVGPSRKAIVGAGVFGGVALGLGILFLTVPLTPAPSAQPAASASSSSNDTGAMQHPAPGTGHGLSLKEALFHLAHRNPSTN